MSDLPPDNGSVVQPVTDTWTVRLVVIFVGVVALAAIVGAIVLSYAGKPVPDAVNILGGAAVTGVVALLASTKSIKQ